MAYTGDLEELAKRYGGVPADAAPANTGPDLEALARKFGGRPVSNQDIGNAAIGPEATNPEVDTALGKIKGEAPGGFNPAAAIISGGRLLDRLNEGKQQLDTFGQYAVKRLFGGGQGELDALEQQRQDMAESERLGKKLDMVHPGSTMIGETAPLAMLNAPLMAGAAALEYGSPLDRAKNVLATLAGNKIAQVGGNAAASTIDSLAKAQAANTAKDAAIAAAKKAGFVTLPTEAGGNVVGRTIEGLTGPAKAQQLASVKNQPVIDNLVRDEFKLAPDAPLTTDTMRAVRKDAFDSGYAPVADWGNGAVRIKPDAQFRADAASISSRSDTAAKSIGGLKSDISDFTSEFLKTKAFTPKEAMAGIAEYREMASAAYAKGDKQMGTAYRTAAEALEGQMDRTLSRSGAADLLPAYRDARQTMAKTFDAEKALNGAGSLDSQALGRIMKKSPDRLSGNLRLIGETANAMPKSTRVPQAGWNTPISAVDSITAGVPSAIAGAFGAGPMSLMPWAIPAARVAGRYGMLTAPGQKMFTNPSYDPSLLLRGSRRLLQSPTGQNMGGLLGLTAAD